MSYSFPAPLSKPFCNTGDEVQPPSLSSETDANQETGFPAAMSEPFDAGGVPLERPQFNGVLNFYTQQILAMQMGKQYTFQDFSSEISGWDGYPQGAVLYCASNNSYQISLINDNTANFITTPSYINDGVHWKDIATYGYIAPTVQIFKSGIGTYTPPTSPRKPLYIRVKMAGGGGGGEGSATLGNTKTPGGDGQDSSFTNVGTPVVSLQAYGGRGGGTNTGAGNSAGILGATGTIIKGQNGVGGSAVSIDSNSINFGIYASGGQGGQNFFAGAGLGKISTVDPNGQNAIDEDPVYNPHGFGTGCGGAGGGVSAISALVANGFSGQGGGAAGYLDAIVTNLGSVFNYSVGAKGIGGAGAGAYTTKGGDGANGVIIVEEYYQ